MNLTLPSHEVARLLIKAMLLFNDKKRFQLRRGGLDSYDVSHEIYLYLVKHGINWLDPDLQPPPSNLRK
jgi:hypothetical protein